MPTGALFRHDSGWAVFVVEGDKVRRTPVEIGWRNGTTAQALSCLSGTERIILHPSDAIQDGTKVAERQR